MERATIRNVVQQTLTDGSVNLDTVEQEMQSILNESKQYSSDDVSMYDAKRKFEKNVGVEQVSDLIAQYLHQEVDGSVSMSQEMGSVDSSADTGQGLIPDGGPVQTVSRLTAAASGSALFAFIGFNLSSSDQTVTIGLALFYTAMLLVTLRGDRW